MRVAIKTLERISFVGKGTVSSEMALDILEAYELIKEMREELREVLVSREHGEAKEMVFITNFAEIESILERTKEYQ